jgi:predicted DNA-binding ribbon-helix-helix protein
VKNRGDKVIASIRVDRELWKEVKKHAIDEGLTLTDLVERLLKEELSKVRRKTEGLED